MHLGAQLLELFLVRHAEMLLLVDDQQAEVLEGDALAEERMGADHDVDSAVGDAFFHPRQLGAGDKARGLADLEQEPRKRSAKVLLARQQRRRHHHRHLLAVHGGDEGRAQRHLGLAEADVPADEAIHRPA